MSVPTTSSMVERMARAIYAEADRQTTYVGKYRFFGGNTVLDGQFDLAGFARAAIEAMREPSWTMSEAGLRGYCTVSSDEPILKALDAGYQAMIDAALKP